MRNLKADMLLPSCQASCLLARPRDTFWKERQKSMGNPDRTSEVPTEKKKYKRGWKKKVGA